METFNAKKFPEQPNELKSALIQPVPQAFPRSFSVAVMKNGEHRRLRIFLTTVKISDNQIWSNGLYQNVYLYYRLLENLGYEPILLMENNENNKDAEVHKRFRCTDVKEFLKEPYPIHAYIEMGMSCGEEVRRMFKTAGAKRIKLYMGNIFNIDVETVLFYHNLNFAHHVTGELDEIWMTPHYEHIAEYAGAINGLHKSVKLVPYVWEPYFITKQGTEVIQRATFTPGVGKYNFIIMEPHISFQKNNWVPICIMEAFNKKYPEKINEIAVINGSKLNENLYAKQNLLPNLSILRENKLKLLGRTDVVSLTKSVPNAIIVQCQITNEYNYSTLEFMAMGYPVVHNISRWKEYGYYYEGLDLDAAADQIKIAAEGHLTEVYETKVKQLLWNYSIYNKHNLEKWSELLAK